MRNRLVMAWLLLLALTIPSVHAATTYFSANYEVGNMSEWDSAGACNIGDITPVATQVQAQRGLWASDNSVPNPQQFSGSVSNGCIAWTFAPGPGRGPHNGMLDGYFSAWYWFGSTYATTDHWHNIMQWMTNKSGGGNLIGFVRADTYNSVFQLTWFHTACVFQTHLYQQTCPSFTGYGGGSGGRYFQLSPIPIPREQWVYIEVYYKAARTNGAVKIWQNGTLIFDLSDLSFNTLDATEITSGNTTVTYACADGAPEPCYDDTMWSPKNYLDANSPGAQTMYMDDVRVTDERICADAGSPPDVPTNLRAEVLP